MTRIGLAMPWVVALVMVAGSDVSPAQPLVTGGLSIYYNFDEFVQEVPDESGNTVPINGTVFGNVRHTPEGMRGGAAEFLPEPPDFVPNDYIDLDGPFVTRNLPERIPTEALTVAMWVNVQPTTESQATYSPWSSNGAFVTHFELQPGGQYRMTLRGQTQADEAVQFSDFDPDFEGWLAFADNAEWFHIAGTYDSTANDGDGEWAYYLNGEEIARDIANGNAGAIELGDWGQGANLGRDPDVDRQFNGRMDEFYLFTRALSPEEILTLFELREPGGMPELQAGDADQDFDFDQFDLIRVQQAAKYLTGQSATWGEGDWNAAPGGSRDNPPPGDGLFNQLDIIAALNTGLYLQGPYAALAGPEMPGSPPTFMDYSAVPGEHGRSEDLVPGDVMEIASLAGGATLGEVDLIYVPEPTALLLAAVGALGVFSSRLRRPLRKRW